MGTWSKNNSSAKKSDARDMEAAVPEIAPPAAKIGSKRKRDGPASENKGEKKPRKPAAVAEPSMWLTPSQLQQIVAVAGSFRVLEPAEAEAEMLKADRTGSGVLPKVLAYKDDGSLGVYKNEDYFLPMQTSTTLYLEEWGIGLPIELGLFAEPSRSYEEIQKMNKLVAGLKTVLPVEGAAAAAPAADPPKKAKKTVRLTTSDTREALDAAAGDFYVLKSWIAIGSALSAGHMTMVEAGGRRFIVWVNIRQVKVSMFSNTTAEPMVTIPLIFELKDGACETRESLAKLREIMFSK